ncbi:hypothetical protein LTR53_018680, partial [Teratosphaeriaceae sp. CCFEE 6253]
EFLQIEDLSERLERTAELLDRFGGWFDVGRVLAWVPGEWSVELVGGFLVRSLRRLVAERQETGVVRALSGGQNLREVGRWGEKVGGAGGRVERAAGLEEEEGEVG